MCGQIRAVARQVVYNYDTPCRAHVTRCEMTRRPLTGNKRPASDEPARSPHTDYYKWVHSWCLQHTATDRRERTRILFMSFISAHTATERATNQQDHLPRIRLSCLHSRSLQLALSTTELSNKTSN